MTKRASAGDWNAAGGRSEARQIANPSASAASPGTKSPSGATSGASVRSAGPRPRLDPMTRRLMKDGMSQMRKMSQGISRRGLRRMERIRLTKSFQSSQISALRRLALI